eukprot:s1669_g10.t1
MPSLESQHHSKPHFVSVWQANIDAVDLSFEVGEPDSHPPHRDFAPRGRAKHCTVRFATEVEFFVGSELDIFMALWPHVLGVPHHRASILQEAAEPDEHDSLSFLAMRAMPAVRVHQDHADPATGPLMQHTDAVLQEEPDLVPQQQTDDTEESEDSWSPDLPVHANGQTFLIFALQRNPMSMRLDLNDYEGPLFVLIYNQIVEPPAHDVWEEDETDSLLQFSTHKVEVSTLSLDQLIPSTTAVRLIDGSGFQLLPTPLEVHLPGNAAQVREELAHWGHWCQVSPCPVPGLFLCREEQSLEPHEAQQQHHHIFWHDDPEDNNGCFWHSEREAMEEQSIMVFLCRLGYARAVALQHEEVDTGWSFIPFHHREPQQAVRHQAPHTASTLPERGPHVNTNAKLI